MGLTKDSWLGVKQPKVAPLLSAISAKAKSGCHRQYRQLSNPSFAGVSLQQQQSTTGMVSDRSSSSLWTGRSRQLPLVLAVRSKVPTPDKLPHTSLALLLDPRNDASSSVVARGSTRTPGSTKQPEASTAGQPSTSPLLYASSDFRTRSRNRKKRNCCPKIIYRMSNRYRSCRKNSDISLAGSCWSAAASKTGTSYKLFVKKTLEIRISYTHTQSKKRYSKLSRREREAGAERLASQ